MDFLERQDEGHNKTELLHSLRSKKARLQQELQALTRQTNEMERGHDIREQGSDQEYNSLVDILEAYRLLGVSIQTTERSITLRFDTMYRNQHPATEYHCVQLIKKGDNYSMGQHNLPPFIPLKHIEEKHLASSVVPFVSEIRNHLYAYVQRREGLKKVQEDFSTRLAGEVEVDLPVTYVNMRVKVADSLPPLQVRLQYDLLRCLPNSVDLVFGSDTPDETETPAKQKRKMDRLVSKWTSTLTELDIHSALTKLL